jgi:hypothetical protein
VVAKKKLEHMSKRLCKQVCGPPRKRGQVRFCCSHLYTEFDENSRFQVRSKHETMLNVFLGGG